MNDNVVASKFLFPHKGATEFDLRGSHPDFGRYTSFGEVVDMETGDALGVLTDRDGDRIVGAVTFNPEDDLTTSFRFSWRQSIQLSNGKKYHNTGKFANQTPPGLVVVDDSNVVNFLIREIRRILQGG